MRVKISKISEPQPGNKFYSSWRDLDVTLTRTDGIVTIQADANGLNPDTNYAYSIVIDDVEDQRGWVDRMEDLGTFKTLVEEAKNK